MAVTKGHSTVIEYGNQATYTGSTSWTKLAGVVSVTPPSPEADDIDVSNMDSEEQFKEFEPGWADGGEVEMSIQFDADQASTVYGMFRQKAGYRVTFSNGAKWGVSGYIKSYGDEVEREGIVTTSIKIKVSGKPTFAKAAA